MIILDEPQRQRQTPVLLPTAQGGVRIGLDPGAPAKSGGNDLPPIFVRFPKVGVGKIRQPIFLI
jgi:hypothetical protein